MSQDGRRCSKRTEAATGAAGGGRRGMTVGRMVGRGGVVVVIMAGGLLEEGRDTPLLGQGFFSLAF